LGNADHGQQVGLPNPLDGVIEGQRLLSDKVIKVDVRAHTSDLLVEFSNGVFLEVFNSSSGYEGWECSSKNGLLVIATGGGELQVFSTDPPLR
jgi:hypothetical protein